MKVYDIFIEPRDVFIFYLFNNKWTTVSHPTLYPQSVARIWRAEDGSFDKNKSHLDRISVPTFRVAKQELEQFYKIHVTSSVKALDIVQLQQYNVFLPQKDVADGFVETGIFLKEGEGDSVNEVINDDVNKFLSLKAFW